MRTSIFHQRSMPRNRAARFRLIDGEHPVRVWREHRRMRAKDLAAASGIASSYLSAIETGKKPGSVSALKRIAAALGVTLDELV